MKMTLRHIAWILQLKMLSVYIRLSTNREPEIYEHDYNFVSAKGIVLRQGDDIALIGTGKIVVDLLKVADNLASHGISAQVINIHTLKPFDDEIIEKAAAETSAILTVEDHSVYGGLGSIVADVVAEKKLNVTFKRMGLLGFAKGYGNYEDMKAMNGIGVSDIAGTALRLVEMGRGR